MLATTDVKSICSCNNTNKHVTRIAARSIKKKIGQFCCLPCVSAAPHWHRGLYGNDSFITNCTCTGNELGPVHLCLHLVECHPRKKREQCKVEQFFQGKPFGEIILVSSVIKWAVVSMRADTVSFHQCWRNIRKKGYTKNIFHKLLSYLETY